ncbi:AAA family ATPase [Nocardioides sp.]|uniref:AAA family ATPase n=1 Tax=Nocardioides sp. TaxID=35761 RepID=UPI003513EF9E
MGERDGELLLIIGPPAAGKMTVGRALCAASDFRLMHNHHTIEPLREIFGHGTRAFGVLNDEFRCRVVAEAAADGLRLAFSFVWDLALPEDVAAVTRLVAPYRDAGRRVSVVELVADLPTRLARNGGADRLAAKPSKQDLAWSDAHVREIEGEWLMNLPDGHDPARGALPADALLATTPLLRLDTAALAPEESAAAILAWLDGIDSRG